MFKTIVERILSETCLHTAVSHQEINYVSFVSIEPFSTDVIRIVIQTSKEGDTYSIEIAPSEYSKYNDIRVVNCDSFSHACVMFKSLHFYRDECIKPEINNMQKMI